MTGRIILALIIIGTAATAAHAQITDDAISACEELSDAEAIFTGRIQPASLYRVSFETEIEVARAKWLKIQEQANKSNDVPSNT